MKSISKIFSALPKLSTAILVVLTNFPDVFAQITITSATFPVAGTTLRMVVAANPAIGIAAYTPPGGAQVWDLSGLQPGLLKNAFFQLASLGTVGSQVPGADLFTIPSPGTEEYYNVTANKVELMVYYGISPYLVNSPRLFRYNPPLLMRRAPMNFFDINQYSSGILEGFASSEMDPLLIQTMPFTADSFRHRVAFTRLDVVDGWGTISIPGGTYEVLREKRTLYRESRLDAKIPPLGWLDVTDNAVQKGFQGFGVDTVLSYHFFNDKEKEAIAVVTLNNDQDAVTEVMYKYNSTTNLSINDIIQNELNSGSSQFIFTVSLSAAAPVGGVTFDIATADNTATTSNGDYVSKLVTSQTIPEGSSTYNFSVSVNGDVAVEPDETFFVNVSNVTGANVTDAQGKGTITNDDCNSTLQNTWLGITAAWQEPSNWSLGSVPTPCTAVIINKGVPFLPTISGTNNNCFSLTLNNGANLNMAQGAKLNIIGH
jgi:hypothetical protein